MPGEKKQTLRGFTIVELTVALTVSAVVLATGYELFKELRSVGEKQSQSMFEAWEITDVLDRIREDLIHAVPKVYAKQLVFVGDNAASEFKRFKLLQFYSFCIADHFNNVSGVRQIHKVEYELVKEKDSVCLYRTATPIIGKTELTDYKYSKRISGKVEEIKISFYDGRRLKTSFSSKQQLPVYLQFELTAYGQTWPLALNLPCGTASTEQAL